MSDIPTVQIHDQDYKLKVTLGFYKRISFPREEMQSIYTNGARLLEVLELAIFFGNKKEKGWKELEDLRKEISNEHLEDINDNNISEKIGTAIFNSLPDALQKTIEGHVDEELEQLDEQSKKK